MDENATAAQLSTINMELAGSINTRTRTTATKQEEEHQNEQNKKQNKKHKNQGFFFFAANRHGQSSVKRD